MGWKPGADWLLSLGRGTYRMFGMNEWLLITQKIRLDGRGGLRAKTGSMEGLCR